MFKKISLLLIFIFCVSSSYAKTISFAEFTPNRGLRAKALQEFVFPNPVFLGWFFIKNRSILKGYIFLNPLAIKLVFLVFYFETSD